MMARLDAKDMLRLGRWSEQPGHDQEVLYSPDGRTAMGVYRLPLSGAYINWWAQRLTGRYLGRHRANVERGQMMGVHCGD